MDFTDSTWSKDVNDIRLFRSIRYGRPETAMVSFCNRLSDDDILTIIVYIKGNFINNVTAFGKTIYHSIENGWKDFDTLSFAFPFAAGEIPVDTELERLSPEERMGREIYIDYCIGCHEKGGELIWEEEIISLQDKPLAEIDAVTSATPYAVHDKPPAIEDLSEKEKKGKTLYEKNCAFCHAMDGTGKNWIGSFIEPHPRDFTSPSEMLDMTEERMRQGIKRGIVGTAMSAWEGLLTDEEIEEIILYIKRAFVRPNVPESRLLQ